MKKETIHPVLICIASLIYFLIASFAFAQNPETNMKQDVKLAKYCFTNDNGKSSIMNVDGNQVNEPIAFQNGATVSLDGIVTWKDGSKSRLENGDCIGVDIIGAVYVAKAPSSSVKTGGVTSNR